MPSWAENRSGGTGGSHPGLNGPELSPVGEAHIPLSRGTKGTRRGVPYLGGVQIRWNRGYPPWNENFSGPVSKG